MEKKKLRVTTFGELPVGMWFVNYGEYLQRGMFDIPKSPVRYVKVSDRRYINAHSLIKGKIPPESRIKQVAHHDLSSNNLVIICPRGWG